MDIVAHDERWLPSPPDGNRESCYLVVLTEGRGGDFAAYAGILHKPGGPTIHQHELDFVARLGNKISETEARCHFPGLPKDADYREL